MTKPVAKSFKAPLERGHGSLGWVVIRIPFEIPETWRRGGRFRVKGEINGFPFRTTLVPTGEGKHILLVNKRMQVGSKTAAGLTAKFRLEPDTEERVAIVPPELTRALSEDRALRRWYDQLTYAIRKEIGDWITQVKSAEARTRRADQIAERLLATMDAERELPPILRVVFARDPLAEEGWNRMSPAHRRRHLFSIFYYRNPEAQARRIAMMVEDACAYAKRKPAANREG
jgi:uncharacterized protein YdeI (YjbR/CyaY-like superfamily)